MKTNTETEKQEFLVFEDLYEVARDTILFLFCICSLLIFIIALVEIAHLPYPTLVTSLISP